MLVEQAAWHVVQSICKFDSMVAETCVADSAAVGQQTYERLEELDVPKSYYSG